MCVFARVWLHIYIYTHTSKASSTDSRFYNSDRTDFFVVTHRHMHVCVCYVAWHLRNSADTNGTHFLSFWPTLTLIEHVGLTWYTWNVCVFACTYMNVICKCVNVYAPATKTSLLTSDNIRINSYFWVHFLSLSVYFSVLHCLAPRPPPPPPFSPLEILLVKSLSQNFWDGVGRAYPELASSLPVCLIPIMPVWNDTIIPA